MFCFELILNCLTEVTSSAANYHPEATSLVIATSLRRPHEVEGQLAEGTCKLGDAVRAGHETCMVGNYTSGCEWLQLRNWELCSTNGNFAAVQHAVQMGTLQYTDAVQMGTWQQLANIRLSAQCRRYPLECRIGQAPIVPAEQASEQRGGKSCLHDHGGRYPLRDLKCMRAKCLHDRCGEWLHHIYKGAG